MNRQEVQEEAIKATEGKQRCSVVLGTGVDSLERQAFFINP